MEKRLVLRKVRQRTLFTIFNPIIVEPLELEYLKSIASSKGIKTYIKDDIFSDNEGFFIEDGSIFVLTGYNVSENQILEEAREIKISNPNALIIVGGLHIERNQSYFRRDYIDYIIHSHDLRVFEGLLDLIIGDGDPDYRPLGYDYRDRGGTWIIGARLVKEDFLNIEPDRKLLYENIDKTRYLDKERVALVKGSVSCPYNCSFCYCREINQGKYLKADYKKLAEEIKELEADYVWIVDDVFLSTRKDALDFIGQMDRLKPNKKIIAYLRADFIIRNEDILKDLMDQGLNEVIIGFEAVSEEELKAYNKGTSSIDYPKVIGILRGLNLDYSGLFMVHPDYGYKDFLNLNKFIRKNKIDLYTISIFTPLKGTRDYERVEDQITTRDPKYFDFLHLVTKSKLPKPIFYLLFWSLHLRLFKSKRVWTYIKNNM